MIPFSIIVKPALVLLIMLLFVARLLLVAFYQQRSGDYFSNKMFYRYTQLEIGCISRRRRIMVTANWLNRFLWLLAMVLVLLLVF